MTSDIESRDRNKRRGKERRREAGRRGIDGDKEDATYPDDTSHTLIVLSLLAETNLSPSCVNLTVEIL